MGGRERGREREGGRKGGRGREREGGREGGRGRGGEGGREEGSNLKSVYAAVTGTAAAYSAPQQAAPSSHPAVPSRAMAFRASSGSAGRAHGQTALHCVGCAANVETLARARVYTGERERDGIAKTSTRGCPCGEPVRFMRGLHSS